MRDAGAAPAPQVALARAVLTQPAVLLLDETLSGLDEDTAAQASAAAAPRHSAPPRSRPAPPLHPCAAAAAAVVVVTFRSAPPRAATGLRVMPAERAAAPP